MRCGLRGRSVRTSRIFDGLDHKFPIRGTLRETENFSRFLSALHDKLGQRLNLTATGFWADCTTIDGVLILNGLPFGIFSTFPRDGPLATLGLPVRWFKWCERILWYQVVAEYSRF